MKVPVLIPNIFDYPFTYKSNLKSSLKPGDYVKVPFGKKELIGVVWNFEEVTKKKIKYKEIIEKIDVPKMQDSMIKFINWFSRYNLVSLGMSLKMTMLSSNIVKKKKEQNFNNSKYQNKKNNFKLSNEQKKCLFEFKKLGNKYNVSVLQGVTGSGKTIVYFERIKEIIKNGKQSLILLPEIALTDQFNDRFKSFFGYSPAIWHSKTSQKNKKKIWRGITLNKIKIVIGARSSLFLPFKKLGLIIVDEEHDQSYKQDEGVRYNARDMAIVRASIEDIPIHLITSIPSIETYSNIENKKYHLTQLTKRYNEASFPQFEVINLNKHLPNKGDWIPDITIQKVYKHLKIGNQVLFFLNRRGYAPFVICKKCNQKFQCPKCSINLNYHKKSDLLLCHYCGFKTNLKRICRDKKECSFSMYGPGVERIYSELKKKFTDKKIEIFSSDFFNFNQSSNKLIKKIEEKKIDILVGTQMISKGFHFPKLNCVVVVDADFTSHGYDIRSAEKNVQLYHQLAGRAGREGKKSKIYFQTYSPDDEILINIYSNNPHNFLKKETELRKEKKLPPFFKLVSLIISGKNETELQNFSIKLKNKLTKLANTDVLGPVNAPIFKIKNKYRKRILLRYPKEIYIQKYLKPILKTLKIPSKIKLEVDVDPINFH